MKKRNGWLYAFWILIIVVVILALMVGLIAWGGTRSEDDDDKDREPESTLSIELSDSSLTVAQGLTANLTVTIDADNASVATIAWTSSDSDVASVVADTNDSAKATVAGNAEGTATITVTVTIDEETVSAECSVTVTAPSATGIELDATSMSVAVGDANTLTVASVTMSDGSSYSGSYEWSSSDETVATVEGNGSTATVTAVGAGAATISVTDDGNAASANCVVTVSDRLAVPDATSDADALKLNDSESFDGYDYTVESTTITSVDEETGNETQDAVYLITGTASAMTEDIVKWYNDGDTGAAKVGDSYITLKIFVGIGNTISYTSAGSEEKSHTNTNGAGVFDGDYLFVVQRLTGVHDDGTQVTSLDGVSYTITDASGNVREEVSIVFDITTVAWDGTSYSTAWYTTTKSSEKDEFTIYSAEELAGLAHIVNEATDNNNDESERSFNSQKVKLGANIDLGSKNWTPIGHQKDSNVEGATVTEYFAGDFDGNGYTIYNLDIEPGEGVEHEQIGLFGHVFGGEFDNIHIHNAKVVGTKNVGALIGGASTGNSSGGTYGKTCTISNCTVDGLVDIEGNYQVGGLIGSETKVTIKNCSVKGDTGSKVTAWDKDTNNTSEYSAGGIVGCAVGDSESTSSIVTTGDWKWSGLSVSGLEISSPARVGGIAGKYYDEKGKLTMENCTVSDCVLTIVTGSATTKGPTIGALIGVYVAEICVLDGNAVTNVTINYTNEQFIGGTSNDATYLLFGGSEPQDNYTDYAKVSFTDSDDKTYTIATSGLTATQVTTNTQQDGDDGN